MGIPICDGINFQATIHDGHGRFNRPDPVPPDTQTAVFVNIVNDGSGRNGNAEADCGLFLGYSNGPLDGSNAYTPDQPGMAILANAAASSDMALITGGSYWFFTHDGTDGNLLMRIDGDGNVAIGDQGSNFSEMPIPGSGAQGILALKNAQPPTDDGSGNVVQIWAQLEGGNSELKVRDSAGHVTTLSSHNRNLLGASSAGKMELDWTMHQKGMGRDNNNNPARLEQNIDMLQLAKAVEGLTGLKLLHSKVIPLPTSPPVTIERTATKAAASTQIHVFSQNQTTPDTAKKQKVVRHKKKGKMWRQKPDGDREQIDRVAPVAVDHESRKVVKRFVTVNGVKHELELDSRTGEYYYWE